MRRSLPTHGFTALSFCLVTVIMTHDIWVQWKNAGD